MHGVMRALIARLDRIGPAAREAAQTCSVLGREFTYELIERLTRERYRVSPVADACESRCLPFGGHGTTRRPWSHAIWVQSRDNFASENKGYRKQILVEPK